MANELKMTIKQIFINGDLTAVLILERMHIKSVKWSDYPYIVK